MRGHQPRILGLVHPGCSGHRRRFRVTPDPARRGLSGGSTVAWGTLESVAFGSPRPRRFRRGTVWSLLVLAQRTWLHRGIPPHRHMPTLSCLRLFALGAAAVIGGAGARAAASPAFEVERLDGSKLTVANFAEHPATVLL